MLSKIVVAQMAHNDMIVVNPESGNNTDPIDSIPTAPPPPSPPSLPSSSKNVEEKEKTPPNRGLGKGKGGKGLNKTPTRFQRRRVHRDNITRVTNPAIRRLARRGGVKRISGLVYQEVRSLLANFLSNVLKIATMYTEYSKRKTVSVDDVVAAMSRLGLPLYGYYTKNKIK